MRGFGVGRVGAAALAIVIAGGCHSDDGSAVGPEPPVDTQLPGDLDPLLDHQNGLPVLLATTAGLPPGLQLVIEYDEKLDDPITHYGECLGRLKGCYEAMHGVLGDCVHHIELCPPSGSGHCCPSLCIEQFDEAMKQNGGDEDQAVHDTFLAGGCIAGFADALTPPSARQVQP